MKKLLALLLLFLPIFAQAAITVPWTATSTDKGYISPNLINGNAPAISIGSLLMSLIPNFEGTLSANDFTGADIGAQINAAYAALPSTGGVITVQPGNYSFNTEIAINTANKPALIECAPAQATTLTYTGSATSTVINVSGNANQHLYGYGISNCAFVGPGTPGTEGVTAAIELGGASGAEGVHLSGVRIKHFGNGLYIGSNTWEVLVDGNSAFSQNGKAVLFSSAFTNAGERLVFTGDNFFDNDNTLGGGGGAGSKYNNCVNFEGSTASAMFTNDSFDDCQMYVGPGGISVSVDDSYFENPGYSSTGAYPYIYIATSTNTRVSLTNGAMMNDATVASGNSPTAFVYNAGGLAVNNWSVFKNGDATVANFVRVISTGSSGNVTMSSVWNMGTAVTNWYNNITPSGTVGSNVLDWFSEKVQGWAFSFSQSANGFTTFVNGSSNVALSTWIGTWVFGSGTAHNVSTVEIEPGTATTAPAFTVASSSNTVEFNVLANGNVGVSSSSAWKELSVGTSNTGTFAISTSTAGCGQFSALGELYSTGLPCGTGSGGGSGTVSTSSSETASYIPFWTSTNGTPATLSGGTANFNWNITGNTLDIGTTSPDANLPAPLYVVGNSTPAVFDRDSSDANASGVVYRKARGTSGTISAVVSGDNISTIQSRAFDGTSYVIDGNIRLHVSGAVSTNVVPSEFQFLVAPPTGGTAIQQAVLTSAGQWGVGTTTPWGTLSASSTSASPALAIQQLGAGPAATILGGNVGIGTINPQDPLDVQGIASSTTFYANLGSVSAPAYSFSGSTNSGMYMTGTQLDFGTAGVLRDIIASGGIISNTAASFELLNASSLTGPDLIPNKADTTTGFGAGTQGNLTTVIGGSETSRWTSTGYGIGTTSPFQPLSVNGNGWFSGNSLHVGDTLNNLGSGPCTSVAKTCMELIGSDNTTAGVTSIIENVNAGASAYSDLFFANNNPNSLANYAVVNLNGSNYNDNTFGTGLNVPNEFEIQDTFGPVSVDATGATGYINFLTGGSAVANERMRITSAGNVGIGTTSPFAALSISTTSANAFVISDAFNTTDALFNTASTTGSIFTVAATTSPSILSPIKLFDIDQYGHITASSTSKTPTVSSCGTGSPAMDANSNDDVGGVTTGTGATSCTITFGSVLSTTPRVFVTGSSIVSFPAVTAESTTGFTIGISGAVTGDDISYWVVMP